MFIAVNCKDGSSRCFEVKLITFDPKKGISIYGEKDIKSLRVYVSLTGDIKTEFSMPSSELNEVKNCKVPGMIFKKNEGELKEETWQGLPAYRKEDAEGEILVNSWNVPEEAVGSIITKHCETVEQLYNNLVSLLA